MYVKEIIVKNSGPLANMEIVPDFQPDGAPKPIVLVGSNGSGKTTILSIIADALIEIAATKFTDVDQPQGISRKYYRVLGSSTLRVGAKFELYLVKFDNAGHDINLAAKFGKIDPDVEKKFKAKYPEIVRLSEENITKFTLASEALFRTPNDDIGQIFRKGAYVFFPSSRAEIPSWANEQASDEPGGFDTTFATTLKKPIIVELALSRLKPWLLDLVLDSSIELEDVLKADNLQLLKEKSKQLIGTYSNALTKINEALRKIIRLDDARIVRMGRFFENRKLQIACAGKIIIPNLKSLSAGQSSLFTIFTTIVKYGDLAKARDPNTEIEGIVCIDEADLHLHPNLQYTGLPELIKLFPRVQFFISSHSPLFPLGMKAQFGEDGFTLLNMPTGERIAAERYDDFLNAFKFFEQTFTFERRIEELGFAGGSRWFCVRVKQTLSISGTAARVLSFNRLARDIEFEWVGSRGGGGLQGSGKNGLNDAWKFLLRNPKFLNRKIVLLVRCGCAKARRKQR